MPKNKHTYSLAAALSILTMAARTVHAASPGECIANEDINKQFALLFSGGASETYMVEDDSCCQQTICGLGCPEEVPDPSKGEEV